MNRALLLILMAALLAGCPPERNDDDDDDADDDDSATDDDDVATDDDDAAPRAEIDIDRYDTRKDALWMAEDAQGVAIDGKSVLDVTVYNGDEAEKILGAVLPKGAKITEVKADTVVGHLEKGGYSIIEKSMSTSDGYTYNNVEGEKAARSYVSIDWEYVPGSSTADEDRELDGGYASVYQGDDNDLSIYVYDYKAANELVKTLVK